VSRLRQELDFELRVAREHRRDQLREHPPHEPLARGDPDRPAQPDVSTGCRPLCCERVGLHSLRKRDEPPTGGRRGHELSASDRSRLVGAYSALRPWPDTRETLERFKAAGLLLAPLANYSPDMLAPLLEQAGLTSFFDVQISTDAAGSFKPDPKAYALGPSALGVPRERIAFAAFGGWDAAGAAWFGFPTFWVNRLGVTAEELAPGPDATGPSLVELRAFVEGWA
jgi:beta-phosphoglucomutase-like phosphatase (HAD superfamily)